MSTKFNSVYASIEASNDTYIVFNNVTGMMTGEYPTYAAALGVATLLHQHYSGVSRQAGW